MNEEGSDFLVDAQLDLTNAPSGEVVKETLEALKNVEKGHYILIDISDYSLIAEIARAVVTKKATVDNVLKKGRNRWTVMVKNDVPVAQTG